MLNNEGESTLPLNKRDVKFWQYFWAEKSGMLNSPINLWMKMPIGISDEAAIS